MKLAVVYGLVFGVISGLNQIYLFNNSSPSLFYKSLPFALLLVSILASILHYKIRLPQPKVLSYKEAVRVGFVVTLFSSFVISFCTYYYFVFDNPSFVSDRIAEAEMSLIKESLDSDSVKLKISQLKESNTIGRYLYNVFTANLIMGMVLSFLLSIFLKGKFRFIN
jgi:hypothetical protein